MQRRSALSTTSVIQAEFSHPKQSHFSFVRIQRNALASSRAWLRQIACALKSAVANSVSAEDPSLHPKSCPIMVSECICSSESAIYKFMTISDLPCKRTYHRRPCRSRSAVACKTRPGVWGLPSQRGPTRAFVGVLFKVMTTSASDKKNIIVMGACACGNTCWSCEQGSVFCEVAGAVAGKVVERDKKEKRRETISCI